MGGGKVVGGGRVVGWWSLVRPRQLDVLVTSPCMDVAAGDEVLCLNDLEIEQGHAGCHEMSRLLAGG